MSWKICALIQIKYFQAIIFHKNSILQIITLYLRNTIGNKTLIKLVFSLILLTNTFCNIKLYKLKLVFTIRNVEEDLGIGMLNAVSGNKKKRGAKRCNIWTLVRSRFNSLSECNNTKKGVEIPRKILPTFIYIFFNLEGKFYMYNRYNIKLCINFGVYSILTIFYWDIKAIVL